MPTLTNELRVLTNWSYGDGDPARPLSFQTGLDIKRSFSNGILANDVNALWEDRRIVTSSTTNDDLDLYGGVTDRFGNTLSFSAVKMILIVNLGIRDGAGGWTQTSGEDILVGGAGAGGNAWAGFFNGDQDAKIMVGPGDPLLLCARRDGRAVTAGTADILRIAHDGGSTEIEYDIVVLGVA